VLVVPSMRVTPNRGGRAGDVLAAVGTDAIVKDRADRAAEHRLVSGQVKTAPVGSKVETWVRHAPGGAAPSVPRSVQPHPSENGMHPALKGRIGQAAAATKCVADQPLRRWGQHQAAASPRRCLVQGQ
jgi:hypothetical protein